MTQPVKASVGYSVGSALWETGKFTVTNPVARKTAMLALAYFIGPCALVATSGYLVMNALGNPDVLGWVGVNDPKSKFIAKIGVSILCAAAGFEVVSASATVLKVAALCGFFLFAAPELKGMVSGTEEKVQEVKVA